MPIWMARPFLHDRCIRYNHREGIEKPKTENRKQELNHGHFLPHQNRYAKLLLDPAHV
jgi:hypothetical protein